MSVQEIEQRLVVANERFKHATQALRAKWQAQEQTETAVTSGPSWVQISLLQTTQSR
jgi:hypothetical protein